MSTGTKVFHNALKIIGAFSSAAPDDPEATTDVMDMYNAMIMSWKALEIDVPLTPIKTPAEELGEPEEIRMAIEYNLAVLAYPRFHTGAKLLAPHIKGTARHLLQMLKNVNQEANIPDTVVSSTLHRGEGVHPQEADRPYFDRGETIGN